MSTAPDLVSCPDCGEELAWRPTRRCGRWVHESTQLGICTPRDPNCRFAVNPDHVCQVENGGALNPGQCCIYETRSQLLETARADEAERRTIPEDENQRNEGYDAENARLAGPRYAYDERWPV